MTELEQLKRENELLRELNKAKDQIIEAQKSAAKEIVYVPQPYPIYPYPAYPPLVTWQHAATFPDSVECTMTNTSGETKHWTQRNPQEAYIYLDGALLSKAGVG